MDLAINILATQTPVAGICNLERVPPSRSQHVTQLATCSSAPRAPHQPAAKFDSWQFGPRQPPRPEIQNDEHLLPLAGREPGPDQARRGQPRGVSPDHDALSKTRAPRGSRSSRGIRTRKFAATSGARSLAKPEATHPSEQFIRVW